MSHLQQNRSSVASRTAFEVLAVEEGEQSEDDVVSEPEAVVSSVVCVELSSHHPHLELNFSVAERPRPGPLKPLSRKQQKLLVKKRNNRIVYLRQGVTRMNVYLRHQLCLLQKQKLGCLHHQIGAPQSLVTSPSDPCLPR